MTKRHWIVALLAVPMVAVMAVGCGSSEEHKATGKVSGKITVGGVPIPEGTIMFIPKHPDNKGPAGRGTIKDGEFSEVTAYRTDQGGGALVGKNTVVIRVPKESTIKLPPEYSDPTKSPFVVDIKEGENTFNKDIPAGSAEPEEG